MYLQTTIPLILMELPLEFFRSYYENLVMVEL